MGEENTNTLAAYYAAADFLLISSLRFDPIPAAFGLCELVPAERTTQGPIIFKFKAFSSIPRHATAP